MVETKRISVPEIKNDIKSVGQDQNEDQLRGFNINCAGYGTVLKQIKDKVTGRFLRNVYILQEKLPCPVFSDTGLKNTENTPFSPCPKLPGTVKPPTKINSIKNNNNNNNINIYPSSAQKPIEGDHVQNKKVIKRKI